MKNRTGSNGRLFRRCTRHTRIFWLALLTLFVLVPPPVFGQSSSRHQRKVDIRGHWGSTFLSARRNVPIDREELAGCCGSTLTTNALGGSVSAAVGARLRLGMEVLRSTWPTWDSATGDSLANTLVSLLVEHEFRSDKRASPYLVFGVGYNHFRWRGPFFDPSLPYYREKKGRRHLGGGIGMRFFLTRHFFVGTELRIGVRPAARWTLSGGYAF